MWGLQAENQFSNSCTKTRTFFMPRSASAYVGFQNRIRGKKSGIFSLSYQEICNSLTKRQIVKCKNTLRANNDQILIALFSQNELLYQVCLTIENTASPVSRDFLTLCSSLGKRCIDNRQCAFCRIGRTDDSGFRKMAV